MRAALRFERFTFWSALYEYFLSAFYLPRGMEPKQTDHMRLDALMAWRQGQLEASQGREAGLHFRDLAFRQLSVFALGLELKETYQRHLII